MTNVNTKFAVNSLTEELIQSKGLSVSEEMTCEEKYFFEVRDGWTISCSPFNFRISNNGIKFYVSKSDTLNAFKFDVKNKTIELDAPVKVHKITQHRNKIDLSEAESIFEYVRENIVRIFGEAAYAVLEPNEDNTEFKVKQFFEKKDCFDVVPLNKFDC